MHFASTAGGLRNRIAAAFSIFNKDAALFFYPDFIGTIEKEAAHPITGDKYQDQL